MSIKIPKSSPAIQIDPGTYAARCYSMIHIGTVEYDWQGQKTQANKVRLTFEFPTETHVFKEGETPKPFVLSQEYSLSLGKKSKLRPILESWRGKTFTEEEMDNFDITKLIGVPAMVTVIENDKGYSDITQITKMPKGMDCPPQINPSQVLDYENWNEEVFNKLPEFIKKKIESTPEYRAMRKSNGQEVSGLPEYPDSVDPNSIPF